MRRLRTGGVPIQTGIAAAIILVTF